MNLVSKSQISKPSMSGIYGADDCTFVLDDVNKNRYYLHNMAEAMRIDAFFSGDEQARHYNTTAMLFSIFDVGLYV